MLRSSKQLTSDRTCFSALWPSTFLWFCARLLLPIISVCSPERAVVFFSMLVFREQEMGCDSLRLYFARAGFSHWMENIQVGKARIGLDDT